MITRRSLLGKAALFAAAGGAAWLYRDQILWPTPSAVFAGAAGSSGWLPISDALSIVSIFVTVGGRVVPAVIDSGAQRSVLDRGFAGEMGLKPSLGAPLLAFGVSGPPQVGGSALLEVGVGALRLSGLRAALLDLTPLTPSSGAPIPLILGQDVLRAVALDLDLPRNRLSFRDLTTEAPPSPVEGALAARRVGRELFVGISLEGRPLEVAVDTGASPALSLSAALAEEAGLLAPGRQVRWTSGINFGGAAMNREVIAESLDFAGRTLTGVPVQIYDRRPAGMLPPGLLGIGALDHARFLIDLQGERMTVLGSGEVA